MKRSTVKILRTAGLAVLFTLLAIPYTSAQEIKTAAPDDILENEAFQIQYDIVSFEPVREMPELADAKDYELVSEPQVRRSSPSPFWGVDYYTLRLTYHFKPKKTGSLKLPRIELIVDNNKLSSREGKINVIKLPEVEDVVCFIKADATKKNLSVGDTLILTYKLYSTKEISGIANIELSRIGGFNYQDITPRRMIFEEENIDGTNYKVYVFCKFLLQATRLGTREIPEGTLKIEYSYPTGRITKDRWGRTYEEQLRSLKDCPIEPITFVVKDMTVI